MSAYESISKKKQTISRSEMEPLPACSEFDYEQNYELFRYIDGIIVMHATPEGNATLTEKIT